jgi:hypothetical protein
MAGDNSIWAKIDSVTSKVGAFVTGTRLGDRHLLDVSIKESVGSIALPGGGGVSSGLTTEVTTVNDTAWTALPPTPLLNRAGFSIQNQSGFQIKINFSQPAGYVGVIIENAGERFYDINDSGVIYAKAIPGAGTISGIIIEELAP